MKELTTPNFYEQSRGPNILIKLYVGFYEEFILWVLDEQDSFLIIIEIRVRYVFVFYLWKCVICDPIFINDGSQRHNFCIKKKENNTFS